jgi:hypothetical protein
MGEMVHVDVRSAGNGNKKYIIWASKLIFQCVYDKLELPCKICFEKGWTCTEEDKTWGPQRESHTTGILSEAGAIMKRTELFTVEFPTNNYYDSDSRPMLDHLSCQYRKPPAIGDDLIPFFLSYHKQNIDYGRYFWFCDHHRFIKERLLDLAKQSDSLQYAIAAFSSLIYSIQVDRHMKTFAFRFYAKAIQKLQQVIDADSMDSEASIYTTVATILELASVEARPCTKNLMIADYW